MDTAQQSLVILSLSKDLGTAVEENCQRLFYSPAKILRLRTPCSAQNDKFGQLLTPNSSFLIDSALAFPADLCYKYLCCTYCMALSGKIALPGLVQRETSAAESVLQTRCLVRP